MRVREVVPALPATPVPGAPPYVEGVVRLRGEVVPVLDVRKRLGLEARSATRKTRFLVVNVGGRPVALVVDEAGEVVRVPRPELRAAPSPAAARFFVGTCGGDARDGARGPAPLRLLLDVKALLDPATSGEAGAQAAPRA
jgi:purine-binding chemotaxis protein CheW